MRNDKVKAAWRTQENRWALWGNSQSQKVKQPGNHKNWGCQEITLGQIGRNIDQTQVKRFPSHSTLELSCQFTVKIGIKVFVAVKIERHRNRVNQK